jgi:hypothetical protein
MESQKMSPLGAIVGFCFYIFYAAFAILTLAAIFDALNL